MNYEAFIVDKFKAHSPSGIKSGFSMPGSMFPHQSALAAWALRRGRAAIFADTGLGKMLIELAWADAVHKYTGGPVMIHTPLAVAAQIAAEGAKFGIAAKVVREAADVVPGINITNYDRQHKFDASIFTGIVLDESGCIKHHDAKTFRSLTDAYRDTPFKLPATATPAPNDWTELGTHAEFLGICTRAEMLAEFFTHDGGDTSVWRLKGHARAIFWRWVASWGAMIRKPSDLGFDDGAYNLPPLNLHEHTVETDAPMNGMLFAMEAQTLSERRGARRGSMSERVQACAATVFQSWGFNDSRQRCAEEVHGRVLQGEPGEVSEADSGTASEVQRIAAQAIRGGFGLPREDQEAVRMEVPGESGAPNGAPTEAELRPDPAAVRCDAGSSGRDLRDLQDGAVGCEDVPDDRSLSQQWKGARDSLLSLQHGNRQVQGQPGAFAGGDQVLEPWVIWVELNAEQDALERAFGDLAFSVRGSQTTDEKEVNLARWLAGERPVMISKTSMLGYGINMQLCAKVAFLGVTDSFESYYQAVRRCWRFGQTRPVDVHLFSSSQEGAVAANLKRKERDARIMGEQLSAETHDAVMAEVVGQATRETNTYAATRAVATPAFLLENA